MQMSERPRPSHLDEHGRLSMVDVSAKPETARSATARARLIAPADVIEAVFGGTLEKGEALAAARLAGIQAAKKTGELIPLCHPLPLTRVDVRFTRGEGAIEIEAEVRCVGRTGVEMEALMAASVAGLTLYDMAKALEKGMTLEAVRLVEKTGGKSGTWRREGEAP
jgi:cyclic pyranopterin phosphate synthase